MPGKGLRGSVCPVTSGARSSVLLSMLSNDHCSSSFALILPGRFFSFPIFLPFPSSVLPSKSTRGSYFCPSFHSRLDLWGRSVELCLPGLGQHKVFDFLCSHFGLVQAVFCSLSAPVDV